MESGLAATQSFVEFGAGAGEVFFLSGCYGADFATATSVDWVELGGDDCGWNGWYGCGRCFVGEKAGNEGGLEVACVVVAG